MRAVGYCRFSSENQRDGFSIEAQKAAIIDFCSKNKIELLDFYIDEALTGTNDKRPAFQRMIDDSSDHLFEAVIVHKLDRFSRSVSDTAIYKNHLAKNGVRLISVVEQFGNSPESIILEQVIIGMNAYYSQNLSREVKKGMTQAALNGYVYHKIPFGYKKGDDNKFQINEDEAEVVRLIFNLYAKGYCQKDIIEECFKIAPFRTYTYQFINRVLMNRFYIGEIVVNGKAYRNITPAIISEDLFNRCNDGIKRHSYRRRKEVKGEEFKKTDFILSGLVFDKNGHAFTGSSATGKLGKTYYYYSTTKKPIIRYQKETLEHLVLDGICSYIENGMNLEYLASLINEKINQRINKKQMSELARKIKILKNKRSRMQDAYIDGVIELEELKEKNYALVNQINSYQNQLDLLTNSSTVSPDILKKAFKNISDQIKSKNIDSKKLRRLITSFLKKAVIDDDTVRLHLIIQHGDIKVKKLKEKLEQSDVSECSSNQSNGEPYGSQLEIVVMLRKNLNLINQSLLFS